MKKVQPNLSRYWQGSESHNIFKVAMTIFPEKQLINIPPLCQVVKPKQKTDRSLLLSTFGIGDVNAWNEPHVQGNKNPKLRMDVVSLPGDNFSN
jgi:hypothetical protein